METFSALLAICAGKSPGTGEFPTPRPVTRGCDVFFDLCLNKRLSKQSWGWWLESLSCPLWRHCNGLTFCVHFELFSRKKMYLLSRHKCLYSPSTHWCLVASFGDIDMGQHQLRWTIMFKMQWCELWEPYTPVWDRLTVQYVNWYVHHRRRRHFAKSGC